MKKKEAFYPLLKSTPIVCPDFEISTSYYYDLSVQTHQTTSNFSKDCYFVSFTGGNQTQNPVHAKQTLYHSSILPAQDYFFKTQISSSGNYFRALMF